MSPIHYPSWREPDALAFAANKDQLREQQRQSKIIAIAIAMSDDIYFESSFRTYS